MGRIAAGVLFSILAGVYLFSMTAPSESPLPGFFPCILRLLTGFPCPLCGMTRAFVRISHGEIADAVRLNALSPFFYLAGIVFGAALIGDIAGSRRFGTKTLGNPLNMVVIVCGVLAVYWAARICVLTHTGELKDQVMSSPIGRIFLGRR